MPRARNIKPGFFLNEDLASLEPLARILFEGLWCLADREGRLEDRPRRIKTETLPYDDCDVDRLLQVLHDTEFILRYEAEGVRYIEVVHFHQHQRPHPKEPASVIPAPDQGCREKVLPSREEVLSSREKVLPSPSFPSLSSSPSDSLSLDSSTHACAYSPDFERIWTIYPRKVQKIRAFKAFQTRCKEGVSPDDLFVAVNQYAAACRQLGTEERFIEHPATFFGPNRPYMDYLQVAKEEKPLPPPSPPSDEVRAELAEQQARFDGLAAQFLKGKVVR